MPESLFELPEPQVPIELVEGPVGKMTAVEVKAALRRRHPGNDNGSMVGQWTCIEEWQGIDLLALNAWRKADVVGYEVKVSRSDMRGELLRPAKRSAAVATTTEFYFAVPAGLLTPDEIAWDEPEWEDGDFRRVECTGVPEFGGLAYSRGCHQRWGGRCYWDRPSRANVVQVPVPSVIQVPWWATRQEGEDADAVAARWAKNVGTGHHVAPCWNCGGKGYLEKSRVEREAPTLWVPRDVGLVTIDARGCRVVKPSPKRKAPVPIVATRRQINDLVRWVSHRPDPRHRCGQNGSGGS